MEEMIKITESQMNILSCVVCKATGDKASKINYTQEVYFNLIDEREDEIRGETIEDFITQIKQKRFYDKIIQNDLIKFLKEFKDEYTGK